MANEPVNTADIKDTDIVFDCPYCSKSLAIDYRGAGLMVPCTDCGRHVQVPIPEGMELSDLDSSREEQSLHIRNLRKQVAVAEQRIRELEGEIEALRKAATRKESDAPAVHEPAVSSAQIEAIRKAVRDLADAMAKIPAPAVESEDTDEA